MDPTWCRGCTVSCVPVFRAKMNICFNQCVGPPVTTVTNIIIWLASLHLLQDYISRYFLTHSRHRLKWSSKLNDVPHPHHTPPHHTPHTDRETDFRVEGGSGWNDCRCDITFYHISGLSTTCQSKSCNSIIFILLLGSIFCFKQTRFSICCSFHVFNCTYYTRHLVGSMITTLPWIM